MRPLKWCKIAMALWFNDQTVLTATGYLIQENRIIREGVRKTYFPGRN